MVAMLPPTLQKPLLASARRHRFVSRELRNQNIISQVSLRCWSVIGWLNFLELRDFVIWLPIHSNPMCQRRRRFSFFVHPQNELRTNIHEWSDEVIRMDIESDVVFLIQCIFVQILWSQSYNNCSGFLVL